MKQGYVRNRSTIPGSSAIARNASTSSWLYVPNCWLSEDCIPDKYTTDNPIHEFINQLSTETIYAIANIYKFQHFYHTQWLQSLSCTLITGHLIMILVIPSKTDQQHLRTWNTHAAKLNTTYNQNWSKLLKLIQAQFSIHYGMCLKVTKFYHGRWICRCLSTSRDYYTSSNRPFWSLGSRGPWLQPIGT